MLIINGPKGRGVIAAAPIYKGDFVCGEYCIEIDWLCLLTC